MHVCHINSWCHVRAIFKHVFLLKLNITLLFYITTAALETIIEKGKIQETVGNSWTVLKVILGHKHHHLLGFDLARLLIRPSDQWSHCRSWRRDTNAEKQTLERRLVDPCVTVESVVTAAAPQSCVCVPYVSVSVWLSLIHI